MAPEASEGLPDFADVPRRTWLAAERTWLAWWRTGLGATGLAIAAGRIVPALTPGVRWPLRVIGLGYGLLAVIVLLLGARRQRRTAEALRRNDFSELSSPMVSWLTAAAVLLAAGTLAVIAVQL